MPVRAGLLKALIKWLGGGTVLALIVGGVGLLWHKWQTESLRGQIVSAQNELLVSRVDEWARAFDTISGQLDTIQATQDASRIAVRAMHEELQEQQAATRKLQHRIRDAPPEDDGAVAPVLRETLESLR